MKYDVFISYRREGGYDTAKHLNDLLTRDGYKVSFDIDTLRNGDFDTQLLTRIEQCKDFILIVDSHAFDRTLDPNFDPQKDWLRCELAHALKHKKNIIPVFLSGVSSFPDGLPEDIVDVVKKNGPEYNKYYFNDFYKKLRSKFLTSWGRTKKLTIGGLFLLLICFVILFISLNSQKEVVYQDPMVPNTPNEAEFKAYAYDILTKAADSLKFEDAVSAKEHWLIESEVGRIQSELYVGLCYIAGYGCDTDFNKAVEYLSHVSEKGMAIAQYSLAICYDNGLGVKKDLERAMELYHNAAEQGLLEAQCDYGIACGYNNKQVETYTWLTKAALQDYVRAQYALGCVYGNQNNQKEAIYWMQRASEQGYDLAKIALANLYRNNGRDEQDFEKALELYTELAEQNNALAQYGLACLYIQGKGVEFDMDKGIDLLKQSAEQGYAVALLDLGILYSNGMSSFQDYNEAMRCFKKAADQGHPIAYIYIGTMYQNGWGVDKDKRIADKWYKKAESQGMSLQQYQQYQYQQQQQQQQNRLNSN